MKKLYLAFLWHMHQPSYKEATSGKYIMPWSFLHAIKDYYEMPWHISNFKKIKATFNLVPSLLETLQDYIKDFKNDLTLSLIYKDEEKLTEEEINYLLDILFSSNLKNIIMPFERYYQLFLKKQNSNKFTYQEILDLKILFLLAWSGNYLRENCPLIKSLIEKGRLYTKEDKIALLDRLISFLKEIIPFYKKLEKKGKIEVSTTPFYHPILPLLIDIESAKEAKKDITLPRVRANFKEDAKKHVINAIYFYKNIFGKLPSGFWPAEGSISNQTLDLFNEYQILWTASDEDVLFNSIGGRNIEKIYQKHKYKNIYLFFRDKYLSDLIGFRYQEEDEEKATDDFISRLRDIYDKYQFSPMVCVILDGENAWEFYKNNGYDFLRLLYKKIEQNNEWIECITFEEAIKKGDIPENQITNIVAGSWIYGDFTTWIGQEEKNIAWEVLSITKNYLETKPKSEEAEKLMLIAEGSDWFWWYGDDHFTHFADKFDRLFRANLQKIYQIYGDEPPAKILKPIKKLYKKPIIKEPNYYITPVIDGEITNYYEWLNAGEIDIKFDAGTMDSSKIFIKKVYYGYDKQNFYLRLDGDLDKIKDKYLTIEIISDTKKDITIDLSKNGENYAIGKILEIKIPISFIGRKNFEILFKIKDKNDNIVLKLPLYSYLEIDISKEFDYEWFI